MLSHNNNEDNLETTENHLFLVETDVITVTQTVHNKSKHWQRNGCQWSAFYMNIRKRIIIEGIIGKQKQHNYILSNR